LSNNNLEAIWIQVKFATNSTLFSVVYRSEVETPNFFENFHSVVEKAWMKTNNIFVLGDLNCCMLEAQANPGSTRIPIKTKKLLNLFDLFGMQNVINQPTRVTPTTKSLIDLIVTTKVNLIRQSGVTPLGISDHGLVYATLKLTNKRPPPKIIRVRNFKHFNVEAFKTDIEQTPFHVTTIFDDKDDVLWGWEQLFNGVCDANAPYKDVKVRSISAPWINNIIRLKMNRRFKLFKEAVLTKDDVKWTEYKKLRNEITADIRRSKSNYYTDKLEEIKTTAEYWRVLSKATNPKIRKSIGPLKRDDDSLAIDDKEKSNLINSYFTDIGEKLAGNLQPQLCNLAVPNKTIPSIYNIMLRPMDIVKKLNQLKPNKATGPDDISPKLLKLAGDSLVGPLTNLYEQSINDGHVFSQWKVARLNPVFKKGDETDRGNYRPLSLLSVPSKILETCVTDTLVNHIFMENKLVTDNQWAYRKGHSTELLLIHLTEIWREAIDAKKVVGIAFIDFQKAFDSVSHRVLLHKLETNFGIKGMLFTWLQDYLSNRKQYTVLNGKTSDLRLVKVGIPQGSVLGPTLFTLYTSDLPDAVISAATYMYADDTTLFCIGDSVDDVTRQLNKALEELLHWCEQNSLTPHPKKCEAMILHRGSFIGPCNALTLGQYTIKWVSHSRLLGITIDDRLTWSNHINEVKKSFANKLNLLKRSRFLPTSMSLDLYHKVILPAVTYAMPVWGSFTNKNGFDALESMHCRAARVIFNLPWDMPKIDVLNRVKWSSLYNMYKARLATLMYKIYNRLTPNEMSRIIKDNNNNRRYQLRNELKLNVPRFNTYYMKNSIAHRGAITWNTLLPELNDTINTAKKYHLMAMKSQALYRLDFNSTSPQTMHCNDINYKFY